MFRDTVGGVIRYSRKMVSSEVFSRIMTYSSYSALSSAIGFVISIYLARVLKPDELGFIGIYNAIIFFVIPFNSYFSLGLVQINKVDYSENDYSRFIRSYISIGLICSSSLTIIFIILSFVYMTFFWLFVVIPVISFARLFFDLYTHELVVTKEVKKFGALQLLNSISGAITTVLFISLLGLNWEGRLIALMLSGLGMFILVLSHKPKWLRNFRFEINKVEMKNIFSYGTPLLIALGASWVLNNIDRVIVLRYFSMTELGYYTLALSLGNVILILNRVISQSMLPAIYEALNKNKARGLISRYVIMYSASMMSFIIFLGGLAYFFTESIFGKDYGQGKNIIVLILFAYGFNGIYQATGVIINYFKMNRFKTTLLYFSAAINLCVSVAFIEIAGLLAPAIGTISGWLFLSITSYYYGFKILESRNVI